LSHLLEEGLRALRPCKPHEKKVHVTIPDHSTVEAEKEGLVLASTSKEFDAYYGQLLAQQLDEPDSALISKRYRCLVVVRDDAAMNRIERFQQLETTIVHFENPKTPAPKRFVRHKPKTADGGDGRWLKCEMRITRVGGDRLRAAYVRTDEKGDPNAPDTTLAHRLWGAANLAADNNRKLEDVKCVMDIEVELLSGRLRPHQLRGQLTALGCPIVGDEVYGGGVCETGAHRHVWNRMAVQCCALSFPLPKLPESDTGDEGKQQKTAMVASDRACDFRLHTAWWTEYLKNYTMTVLQ